MADAFLAAGADVITLGNHAWDRKELIPYIAQQPRVVRPLNFPAGTPGQGSFKITLADGRSALVLNAIILIACLANFDAVLTLPGIAGIILTIGMAVDSNVLIFERIREEVRAGKAPHPAVDAGFGKALLTIIDTHVTTVVSCAVLFLFGSGPVKGFAVTLVIGLIANVFTAIFVSKFIFEWELTRRRPVTALSI